MRALIWAVAVLALGPALGASDVERALLGSWRLVSYEDKPATGPIDYPYGQRPRGLLIYDATGHMAIQIMKNPHPNVASGDEERATPQEKLALLDAYVAYFGTYRVDVARGVVITRAEGDLYDVYVGRDEERSFELSGDRLTLKTRWAKEGQAWSGTRAFLRIK